MLRVLVPSRHHSFGYLMFHAVLCAAVGVIMMTPVVEVTVPDRAELVSTSGTVAGVVHTRSGIRFRLAGNPLIFNYPPKAGGGNEAEAALAHAGEALVTVTHAKDVDRAWFSDTLTVTAWEMSVGGRMVRSLDEAREHAQADHPITRWIAAVSAMLAAYFFYFAWRAKRRERYPLD